MSRAIPVATALAFSLMVAACDQDSQEQAEMPSNNHQQQTQPMQPQSQAPATAPQQNPLPPTTPPELREAPANPSSNDGTDRQ